MFLAFLPLSDVALFVGGPDIDAESMSFVVLEHPYVPASTRVLALLSPSVSFIVGKLSGVFSTSVVENPKSCSLTIFFASSIFFFYDFHNVTATKISFQKVLLAQFLDQLLSGLLGL